jgi:PAS domain-containing protein
LFDIVPCPALVTDRRSTILQANAAAGRLFNLASRRLAGRDLLLYTHHRDAFLRTLADLPHGDTVAQVTLIIRPRERRPIETTATISAILPEHSGTWLWFFAMPDSLPLSDVDPVGDDATADLSPSVEPGAAAVPLAGPRGDGAQT